MYISKERNKNTRDLPIVSCDTRRGYLKCQWAPLAPRNSLVFKGFITNFQQKCGTKRKRTGKGNWKCFGHSFFLGFVNPSLYSLHKHIKDTITLKACFTVNKNKEYK